MRPSVVIRLVAIVGLVIGAYFVTRNCSDSRLTRPLFLLMLFGSPLLTMTFVGDMIRRQPRRNPALRIIELLLASVGVFTATFISFMIGDSGGGCGHF